MGGCETERLCVYERERERENRGRMKNESKFLLETNDKRAGNDLKKKSRTGVSLITAIIIIMTGQR